MRELAILSAVVVLVYLFQCLSWVPARSIVFSLELSGKNSRIKRGFLWSALGLNGYWSNPLPPLQPLVVVQWPAYELEPERLRIILANTDPIVLRWEELTVNIHGNKLLCNGKVVLQSNAEQLKVHQELLKKLQRAKAKERKKLIDTWLRKAIHARTVKDRLKLFQDKSGWLEFAVNLQFCLLFIFVPFAFIRFGTRILWPALAMILATSILAGWQSWRLNKLFYPNDSDGRFKSLFSTLFSPIYAVRAMDSLARDLVAGFHPLTVAAVVCSQQELETLASQQVREAQFGESVKSAFANQLQLLLTNMLANQKVDAKQLLAEPPRDEGCVQYCPRCLAQYTNVRESCADCGYAGLMVFKEPAQPELQQEAKNVG